MVNLQTVVTNAIQGGQNLMKGWAIPRISASASKFSVVAGAVGAIALCIFLAYSRHSAIKQVKALEGKNESLSLALKNDKSSLMGQIQEGHNKLAKELARAKEDMSEYQKGLESEFSKKKDELVKYKTDFNETAQKAASSYQGTIESLKAENKKLAKELKALKDKSHTTEGSNELAPMSVPDPIQDKMQKVENEIANLGKKIASDSQKLELLKKEAEEGSKPLEDLQARKQEVIDAKKELTNSSVDEDTNKTLPPDIDPNLAEDAKEEAIKKHVSKLIPRMKEMLKEIEITEKNPTDEEITEEDLAMYKNRLQAMEDIRDGTNFDALIAQEEEILKGSKVPLAELEAAVATDSEKLQKAKSKFEALTKAQNILQEEDAS